MIAIEYASVFLTETSAVNTSYRVAHSGREFNDPYMPAESLLTFVFEGANIN